MTRANDDDCLYFKKDKILKIPLKKESKFEKLKYVGSSDHISSSVLDLNISFENHKIQKIQNYK